MAKRKNDLSEQEIHELMNQSESQSSETSSIFSDFSDFVPSDRDIYEIIDKEKLT